MSDCTDSDVDSQLSVDDWQLAQLLGEPDEYDHPALAGAAPASVTAEAATVVIRVRSGCFRRDWTHGYAVWLEVVRLGSELLAFGAIWLQHVILCICFGVVCRCLFSGFCAPCASCLVKSAGSV